MIDLAVAILLIRVVNAVLWTVVVVRILRHDRPLAPLIRRLVCLVVGAGMWAFVLGTITTVLGASPEVGRNVYTIYTIAAAIVAVALLTGDGPTSE